MFLMAGSTSTWTRPIGVALMGATLLASLSAAVFPRLQRVAAFVALAAFPRFRCHSSRSVTRAARRRCAAQRGTGRPSAIRNRKVRIAAGRNRHADRPRGAVRLHTIVRHAVGVHLHGDPELVHRRSCAAIDPARRDYLYFGFITQLTVGYGDLTAAQNLGRACRPVLEALLGSIYLVTVVALLVSQLVPRAGKGDSSPGIELNSAAPFAQAQ